MGSEEKPFQNECLTISGLSERGSEIKMQWLRFLGPMSVDELESALYQAKTSVGDE